MKIIVCFKVLPEPDRVLQEDWEKFTPDRDLGYAGLDFSCFDGPALELGLRLKQQMHEQGISVSCSALTLGKTLPEGFSQRLYSVGYDLVQLIPVEDPEFCPEQAAEALSEAVAAGDVILTGREAGMGETGMVPYLMAEKLHRPLHADVENISFQKDMLILQCRKPEGLFERKADVPCLLTVGNTPAVLRTATLRQQLKFQGKKAEILKNNWTEFSKERLHFYAPDTGRKCRMLDPHRNDTRELLRKLIREAEVSGKQICNEKESMDAQMLSLAAERENLFLFPDTEGGRTLAIKKAAERNIPCFFGGEILELTEASVRLQKGAYGSNLLWRKEFSLPAVLTGNYPGMEEKREESLLIPADDSGLQSAGLVMICGNGMGSRENCMEVRALSAKLHGAVGFTRPAVMNAWGNTEEMVGQSGKTISPGLCLTLGVGGSGAFVTGIRKSKTIVAVNRDPNALIFKCADYGILMDAMEFLGVLKEEAEYGN